MSTQTGFGAILNEIGRGDSDFARRIVTTSPDVTVSTNLGPWVNRRGLFAREKMADTFKSEHIPSTFNWEFSPQGPAYRARHRRDEPVHPAVGARAVAQHQWRAAAADRHAVRSLHRARSRCAQLRLLPGCALHAGGDAVRHHARRRRRRASVDRRAADRHGAGWPRRVSSPLMSTNLRSSCAWAFAYMQKDGDASAIRAQLAARRDRRLGLSAALDAPDRTDPARR